MAERRSASGLGKQDKGKAKVGEPSNRNLDLSSDDDQTMPASQENQSDGSGTPLPFKKRWADEADAQQEFDLEVDEIPQENTGAASNKHKESKVDDDQVPLKKTYDQSERNVPGPGSRILPREAICFSKILSSFELIPVNHQLYLDPYDASILTNCPELIDYPPCSYTKNILVFDGDDRRYDMVLSQYTSGGWIRYSLSADWNRFVRVHNLKAGDEITFYKNFDKSVSDDYYYILKYFRRPADRKGYVQNRKKPSNVGKKDVKGNYKVEDKHKGSEQTELNIDKIPQEIASLPSNKLQESKVEGDQVVEKNPDQTKRNLLGPGSRALPREAYRISQTLTSFEVIPENCKLYLDAYEASILTDCPWIVDYPPGSYSKNLVVFDKDDRQYDMLLSHYISEGKISYSLNAGWRRFVRTHNLKDGDQITFYKNLDKSVSDDYYYILKYFRKPADHLKGFAPYRKKPSDAGQKDFRGGYEVEDKHKESEQTKLKVDRIPQEKASVPSDKHQESKVEDVGVVEKTPDQTERNLLGPGSRALPREAYCLSKILTSFEVIPENSKLYFDAYEAIILTDCPWILDDPPGTYSKNLVVFDGDDRRYNMLLTHYISGGKISYSLNTDWNRFVRTHNLKEGDEITFYRNFDRSISDDYYHIIKYFRKPADLKGFAPYRKKPSDAGQKDFKGSYMVEDKQKESEQTQFKVDKIPQENTSVPSNKDQESKVEDDVVEYTPDQTERNLLGPGSRAMQPEAYCLSKTLTSFEVIPDDSKLYFDAYEATMLTDCPWIVEYPPGSYSKNLLVFDADDRRYNMLLSHYISGGNISYSLNTEWNRFLRTHNLRDGDEITFYRILDRSVSDEYYYIIKYFRRPARP